MANHRTGNFANQVGRKYKSVLDQHHDIESFARIILRNRASKRGNPFLKLSLGVELRRLCAQIGSSTTNTPRRVLARAAKDSATGNPRDHTTKPALVSTGQAAR